MVLDVIGILLIFLFFIRGYSKGFIVALFSIVAILLGIIVSLKLSHGLATWLLTKGYVTPGWAQLASYLILFISVMLIVRLLARLLQKAIEGMMLGMVNKLIGGLLYAFFGAILWSSFLWIGGHMHIIAAETIATSKTYSWLSALAPWFFEQVSKLLPFAKDTFSNLEHFFSALNQKPTDHVGAH